MCITQITKFTSLSCADHISWTTTSCPFSTNPTVSNTGETITKGQIFVPPSFLSHAKPGSSVLDKDRHKCKAFEVVYKTENSCSGMMESPCDKGECMMFKSHAWDENDVYLGRYRAKKSVQRKLGVACLRVRLYADGQFWREMFRDVAMYRYGGKVV